MGISSAATSTSNVFQNTSAATDVSPFAGFWSMISTYIPWTDYFAWQLPIEHETIELPAHEKSVHGRTKGRLKEPKPQCPRGYKYLRLRNEYSGPHFK